ncbi:MAG TPA: Gfo/Idh/MocA family oxidoreductase, partial [Armatimonadota bacterium]|nr:Gfo/Idh/MocA family oxidoreductase [Armatimonadota bacterium]
MKTIRVGIFGLHRGLGIIRAAAPSMRLKLVALCDSNEPVLREAAAETGAEGYTDYGKFLEHDTDAVIVANSFHEHAPHAIQALKASKHVLSETAACFTLAEGVELIEAVEESGRIYMFAENYQYNLFSQEITRVFRSGKLGQFMYGEAEYVHPADADFWLERSCGVDHWRNWIPATYYCTHAVAPIMMATDTMPVKVNGFVMPHADDDPVAARSVWRNDAASVIVVRMDNGAVAKLLQYRLSGYNVWVRIHGSRGTIENLRHGNQMMVHLRREQFHERKAEPTERIYLPRFAKHHEQAIQTAHAGSDFFVNYHFAEAIRKNEQPYLDVYRGVAMSVIGPLACRSALDNSSPIEVPDLRKPSVRRKYANDHWRPDPATRKK